MSAEAEIRRHAGPEALAEDVAERLLVVIREVQADGRVPQVVLTGGTIADTIHATLARLAPSSQVDWRSVDFWWGDERFVARGSEDRNAVQARRAFLDHVDVDPARVHEAPSTESAASVDEAAAAYGDEVRGSDAHEFDVVMLGLGPDGHVASLFPGFAQVEDHDHVAVGVTDSPKPPPERISLTLDALNHTRATWFLVSGEGKADAVAQALDEGPVLDIPARGAAGREETVWFLDDAAASALDT
ncbi:6-phosphogluconolactonase [Marmoricola endophyticus]|uniref:6-phosphogluconolactonase n=1 Tax=Marmoricola endophyticus TaxID=2040280 RepID=A0A917BAB7_9ACTN|nr:6-phosphogluconolactonase [Marmoricola endophyticus]GGF33569.1 6-phosphogluconolactonase [Marmoricola endophyticus]